MDYEQKNKKPREISIKNIPSLNRKQRDEGDIQPLSSSLVIHSVTYSEKTAKQHKSCNYILGFDSREGDRLYVFSFTI